MQTEFYLLNLSFQYQEGNTTEDIEDAIKALSEDYDFIKAHKDTIARHDSVYYVEFYPDYKIEDLFYPLKPCPISKDTKKFLQKIIDHSKETNWTNEEVLELINGQEIENLCKSKQNYGLLALFNIETLTK